ncbi:MAG: hypothetical protein MZV64_22820 [Ignavibacteriales bacterium]|nr:hypothetical protein [Ignavibacteriales bacterium]
MAAARNTVLSRRRHLPRRGQRHPQGLEEARDLRPHRTARSTRRPSPARCASGPSTGPASARVYYGTGHPRRGPGRVP